MSRFFTATDRYIFRLVLVPMLGIFMLAASLLLLEKMLRLFEFVSTEGGPINVVFQMLLNVIPEYAGLAIPLGLMLGILFAFRKLATTSELDVLRAVEGVVASIELVDSRVADWKIKLVDTIADNASYGGFTLGPWDRTLPGQDLGELAMRITQNGELAAEGVGKAALGHPAKSTAWLVNKLGGLGVTLKPGDIVISGAITKMIPAKQGAQFTFALTGQADLTLELV